MGAYEYKIAFVVGNSGSLASGTDIPFYNHLDDRAFDLTTIDDSAVSGTDFSPYNMIFVSSSVVSATISGLLKTVPKPVMFLEGYILDEMGMSSSQGTSATAKTIYIDDVTHHITKTSVSGSMEVYDSLDNFVYATTWSGANVDMLAYESGDSAKGMILEIEKNQTLYDSSVAAERRVYWGMIEGDELNVSGWELFDRAIDWCLYNDDIYVAFVVADPTSLNTSTETPFKNRMETELSLNVVLIKDDDAEYNLENCNMNMIMISREVTSTDVDGLKSERVPLTYMKQELVDDFDLGSSSDYAGGQTQIKIVNTGHFITRYETSGNLAVYSSGDTMYYAKSWSNDVVNLAENDTDSTESALTLIEMGDKLDDGGTATHRRLHWGMAYGNKLNAAGWRLFDRSVAWLLQMRGYVAYITETASWSTRNKYWKDQLASQRLAICQRVTDNNAETHTYTPYDLIIVGRYVEESYVDGLKSEATPLMFYRHFLEVEYGMGTGNNSTNAQVGDVENSNYHYIVSRFPDGDLTVHNTNQALDAITGTSNDVMGLLTHDGVNARKVIAICKSGDTLSDSTIAAHNRCFFGLSDMDDPHENTNILFERSVIWCLGLHTKKHVAYLVNEVHVDNELPPIQQGLYDRLTGKLDYIVELISDNEQTASGVNYTRFDGILKDKYTDSVHTYLKPLGIGILTGQNYDWDDIDLGIQTHGEENQDDINIVDNSHFITSPFSTGVIQIWDSGETGQWLGSVDQAAGGTQDLLLLARLIGNANYGAIMICEKDEDLADATDAKDRRAFYGGIYNSVKLTNDGWILFDRAMKWIMYEDGEDYIMFGLNDMDAWQAKEESVYDRLRYTMGFNVLTVQDKQLYHRYKRYEDNIFLVFAGGGVGAEQQANLYTEPIPVVTVTRWANDDMGFGGSNDETGSLTDIKITRNDHFITRYETLGDVTVYSSAGGIQSIGQDAYDIVTLAQRTTDVTLNPIALCEKGDKMYNGDTCAARRVYWGLADANRYNTVSWRLFDRMIYWILTQKGYFEDYFQSGNYTEKGWVTVTGGGSTVAVNTENPIMGAYGIKATTPVGSNYNAFLRKDLGESKTETYQRAFFRFTTLPQVSGSEFTPIAGGHDVNNRSYGFGLYNEDGTVKWSLFWKEDAGWASTKIATPTPASGMTYCAEVYWKSHGTNGEIRVWLDGEMLYEKVDFDNDQRTVRYLEAGLVDSDEANTCYVDFDTCSNHRIGTEDKIYGALIVADKTTLTTNDELYLERLYYTNNVVSRIVTDNDAETESFSGVGDDLVIASPTADWFNYNGIGQHPLPLMGTYGRACFSGTWGLGLNWGSHNDDDTYIIDTSHYITGLNDTGALTVHTQSRSQQDMQNPANDVKVLSYRADWTPFKTIVIVEKDGDLTFSGTAPERRTMFGVKDMEYYVANAYALFDRAVEWLAYEEDELLNQGASQYLHQGAWQGLYTYEVEIIGQALYKTLTEGLGVGDSLGRVTSFQRVYTEGLGVSDDLVNVILFVKSLIENLGVSDSYTDIMSFDRTFTEGLGVADSYTDIASFIREMTEGLGISDEHTRAVSYVRGFTEGLGVADDRTDIVSFIREYLENLGISDELEALLAFFKTLSEGLGLSDNIEFVASYSREMNETLGLSDNYDSVMTFVKTLSENLGLTDEMTRTTSYIRGLSETLGISDTKLLVISIVKNLVEGLGISDNLGIISDFVRDFPEGVGISDEFTRTAQFYRDLLENLGISDVHESLKILATILRLYAIITEINRLTGEIVKVDMKGSIVEEIMKGSIVKLDDTKGSIKKIDEKKGEIE